MAAVSTFQVVEPAPPDAVFNVLTLYKEDTNEQKVNLSVGAYRNEQNLPWVLPVVRTIEAQMSSDAMLDHEYLPIDGLKLFNEKASRLVLGDDSEAITQNRYCAIQCISGTGSLRIAMEFLRKFLQTEFVYISKPTWPNHRGISVEAGFDRIMEYRYFNPANNSLDLNGLLEDLTAAPEGSIVIFHTCAHNPTGVDPTRDEWKKIINIVKQRKLFPVMDTAYIGFASGDIDNDSWPVREMVRQKLEFFVAQSFSKNFGLYNERVGQLCCVLSNAETAGVVLSQLKIVARRMWSNPPHHGARIVATALNNPTLHQEWIDNITTMTDRIKAMRKSLYHRLKSLGTPGDWTHIINQIGMFSYTGLTAPQVDFITKKYHIYLLASGRINICGLTHNNLDYVAEAIHDAVTSKV